MIFFLIYIRDSFIPYHSYMIMLLFQLYVFVGISIVVLINITFVGFFIRDVINWCFIYYWNNAPIHSVMYKVIQLIHIYNKKHPTRQVIHTLWYIDDYIPYYTVQEINDIHRSNAYFRTLCIQHGINIRLLQLISRLTQHNTYTTPSNTLILRYKNTRTTHLTRYTTKKMYCIE